jgi:hypothetical protein
MNYLATLHIYAVTVSAAGTLAARMKALLALYYHTYAPGRVLIGVRVLSLK